MNIHFLTNPTQRIASNKRLPTAELETLILYGHPAVRARILKKASANCHVLAANPNTFHVVEALVRVSDPAALAELLFEVRRHISALAQSRHGNIVIQEILRRVPAVVRNDLTESIIDQCYALATGEFGNRVVQALLVPSSAAVHLSSPSTEANHDCTSQASYYAGDDTSISTYSEHLSATVADKIYEALAPRFDGLATNEFGQAVVAAVVTNEHRKMIKMQEETTANIADFLREQYLQQIVDTAEPNPFITALRSRAATLLTTLWNMRGGNNNADNVNSSGMFSMEADEDSSSSNTNSGRIHLLCAMIRASKTLFPKSGALKRFIKEMVIGHALQLPSGKKMGDDGNEEVDMTEEEKEKQLAAAEKFVAERSAVFVALCEARAADWGVAVLEAIMGSSDAEAGRMLEWSKKQHLATIVEALIRHVVPVAVEQNKTQLVQKLKKMFCGSEQVIRDLIVDRYGGIVARELARSKALAPPAAVVQDLAARSAALCTQASYSLFFQALLQQGSATPAASKNKIVREMQSALQQGNAHKKLLNDPAASRLLQFMLEQPDKKPEFVKSVYDCVSAGIQESMNNKEDGAQEEEEQEVVDDAADPLQEVVGDEEDNKQQEAAVRGPVFTRIATSPNGSHVLQSLLRATDDAQLEALTLFASSQNCRVSAKFRGLPALARNKYGCHVMCEILQQLKLRSTASPRMLELCRASMNLLKPHVHFLALAASTGRRVFEVMCRTGSAELKGLMRDVVALKCETYLRGDPFLEGDDDADEAPDPSKAKGRKTPAATFNQRTHHLEKKKKQMQKQRRSRSGAQK